MTIKTIVVDDEFLARKKVMKLLESHDEVKVIGECKNAAEAIELINKKEPDLVFLDIQMPDNDGFYVLRNIELNPMPQIIFATAYDQYAIKAFEVNALNYLLKPLDEDRFNEAITQALSLLNLKKTSTFNTKLINLINEFQQKDSEYINSFSIKDKGRIQVVAVEHIYFLEATGNYITIHSEDGNHLYRSTMNAIEEQLNPEEFIRIHRSFMLNTRYIKNYKYLGNNEYLFTLKNKQEITSSRSYKEKIQEYLSY